MVGLDVTHRALLTPAWAERFRAAGRTGTFVAELVDFFKRYHARTYGWDGAPIHDAVALAHVLRPELARRPSTATSRSRPSRSSAAAAPSSTAGGGQSGPPNAHVAVDIDADGFFELLLERIASLGDHLRGDRAARDARFDPGPTRDALEEIGRRFEAAPRSRRSS